jgi:hypothetical protein
MALHFITIIGKDDGNIYAQLFNDDTNQIEERQIKNKQGEAVSTISISKAGAALGV